MPSSAALRVLSGLLLVGCEGAEPVSIPGPSYTEFRDEVYPILMRDCGFVQCHGDPDRFFVIHGPGRKRLDASSDIFDPPTEADFLAAYDRTRGMLSSDTDVLDSPLLTKPLEGRGHGGLDEFGRNVWQAGSPEFAIVEAWARRLP